MSFRQGARQFFERRGAPSGPTARDYVQNGLIAMWDGIENAGWGVHDAAATTWKDLVGSNDMTLSPSGISFGQDSIVCVQGGYAAMASSISSFLTMEAVLSFDSAGPGRVAFSPVYPYTGYDAQDRWITMRANGTVNFCGVGKYIEGFGVGAARSLSCTYASLQAAAGNDVVSVSLDGSPQTISTTGGGYGFGAPRCVGVSPQSGYYFAGKIHSIRIYSLALTAAEIAENHSIDKARFNLP